MTPADRDAIIVSESIKGLSVRDIAPIVGISRSNVHYHQKKLRAHIQQEAAKIYSAGLTTARKGLLRTSAEVLVQFRSKDKGKAYDKDLIAQGNNANKLILQAAQLIGQMGQQTIFNILATDTQAIPPIIQDILSHLRTSGGSLIDGSDNV